MSRQIPENQKDLLNSDDIKALPNGTNIWVIWRDQGPYFCKITDTSDENASDVWVLKSRLLESGIGSDEDSVKVWLDVG